MLAPNGISDSPGSAPGGLELRPETVKSVEVSEREARSVDAPASLRAFYEVGRNAHPEAQGDQTLAPRARG
jgi:hypothetical protein